MFQLLSESVEVRFFVRTPIEIEFYFMDQYGVMPGLNGRQGQHGGHSERGA